MTRFRAIFALLVLMGCGSQAFAENWVSGWLTVNWGDPQANSNQVPVRVITLATDGGGYYQLDVSDAFFDMHNGLQGFHGQRVEVLLAAGAVLDVIDAAPVQALMLADTSNASQTTRGGGVFGPQPWVSILCKFSDISDEPENLAYFSNMYGNQVNQLDHYWRKVSYENINVVGSLAVDWVSLPNTQTSYISTPGSGTTANLTALFNDCTAAADAVVDFSNAGSGGFEGINMMFNGLLDCCAWGGGQFATLDGISKVWRTTWEPPWGYADEAVIAHEMGHGFGLPHTNNSDNDSNPYDSPWDVMSAATSYSVSDPVYGRIGKHVNAYHKRNLGWIDDSERFLANVSSTITIDALAVENTSNFRMARIDISGTNRYYTVESRLRIGDYDQAMPGDAVIIHEVIPGRSEPSWVLDENNPAANFADTEGVMWRVGETFVDNANEISVHVDAQTAAGFVVTIGTSEDVLVDGFE